MESLLQETGNCGRFQICHVTVVQLCRFVTVFSFSLMIFGLYNPGWRCVDDFNQTTPNWSLPFGNRTDDLLASYKVSLTNASSTGVPLGNNVTSYDAQGSSNNDSEFNQTTVTKKPTAIGAHALSSYSGTCDIINSCSAIEFDPASSTVVSEFGLVCDRVWIAYVIVSALSGGMLIGSFIWGQIGETYGRRVSLYASNFIMALSCGLAVFSPMWQVYAVFTFFIGFGAVGTITSMSVLCMEFINATWRARVGSIPVWNMGIVCFALVVYLVRDWKNMHIASAGICGFACFGFFWTPESLRWLLLHGRRSEAERVIQKISKLNKKHVSDEVMKELVDKDPLDEKMSQYTYLDLFRTYALRILTIKLSLVWIITVCVYDIIGYAIQALPGDFYTNLVLASLVEFPSVFLIGPLANKFGRRWTGILFSFVGTLSCVIIVTSLLAIEEGDTRGLVVSSSAFITKSAMQGLASFLMPYSAELLPTAVRNLGFGFIHFAVRVVGIFGPFLLPRDYPSMIACFSVVLFAQIVSTLLFYNLDETKGQPLSDRITPLNRTEEEADNQNRDL